MFSQARCLPFANDPAMVRRMSKNTLLLCPEWLVCVDPQNRVLKGHCVVVSDAQFRMAMTAGVAVGATEIQLNLIAGRILGLPRE